MSEILSIVMSHVLGFLIPLAFTLVAGTASWALAKLGARYNITVVAAQRDEFRGAIHNLVGAAERWAAGRLKLDDVDVKGREKLEWVLKHATRLFPERSREEIEAEVLAALDHRDQWRGRVALTQAESVDS